MKKKKIQFNQWVNEGENPDFDGLISTMTHENIKVTALGVPSTAISGNKPYEVIELTGGLEAIVAISEDYLIELLSGCDDAFRGGFTLGLFIGHVLSEALGELADTQ